MFWEGIWLWTSSPHNLLVLLIDVGNPPGIVHIKTHPLHFIFKPWSYMFSWVSKGDRKNKGEIRFLPFKIEKNTTVLILTKKWKEERKSSKPVCLIILFENQARVPQLVLMALPYQLSSFSPKWLSSVHSYPKNKTKTNNTADQNQAYQQKLEQFRSISSLSGKMLADISFFWNSAFSINEKNVKLCSDWYVKG